MPKYASRLQLYEGKEPLFHRYGLEEEIGRIHQRKVPLKGGGSIVIDTTEALVARAYSGPRATCGGNRPDSWHPRQMDGSFVPSCTDGTLEARESRPSARLPCCRESSPRCPA
jgi:hypothetical protein